ncbi:MAG: GAF domain-containing protein [Deltaproteobacteria bacterium]|nr:GAF domain-containing protein [Deltaproteobacteria bacterium]
MGECADNAEEIIEALKRSLARERERTRALQTIGRLLDSTAPMPELLQQILAAAMQVTEAERATLYVLEADQRTLVSTATEGGTPTRIVLPVSKGIAGACATSGQTIVVPDAYADPRFDPAWDQRTGFRTRAVLAVPMKRPDGQLVGVVQVLNRRDAGGFDDDDISTLQALAAQAGVALESARTLAELVEQNRTLIELRQRQERSLRERDLLLEIEQLLSRVDSLDEFLAGTLEELVHACRASSGCVALTDPLTGISTLRAVRGVPDAEALVGRAVADKSSLAKSVHQGSAQVFGDDSAPGVSAIAESARTLLVVPLVGPESQVCGAVELRDHRERGFSRDDRALAELVAANLATGIELWQARLERERASRLATVGRTLGSVLHDIRTPMTIISGYAQLMPDVESREERSRYARLIVRQFELVQAMIAELLAFVRGESQVLFQRVLIEPFFTELVEVLRRDLASRGVTVTLTIHERGAARFDPA